MGVKDWNWRIDPPRPSHHDMVANEWDGEPSIFQATESYTRDKMVMGNALGIDYAQVRMETVYLVWAPLDAEADWREDRCECEEPHYRENDFEGCETTKPAEQLEDFWDEGGSYCPWVPVKRSVSGAVKFRRPSRALLAELRW